MRVPLWISVPLFMAALFVGMVRELWKLDGRPKFWRLLKWKR
jgi:hypothetical protein